MMVAIVSCSALIDGWQASCMVRHLDLSEYPEVGLNGH